MNRDNPKRTTAARLCATLAVLLASLSALADDRQFLGDFHAFSEDDGLITLTLTQTDGGDVSGNLSFDGYPASITARITGSELVGVLNESDGESYRFRGRRDGTTFHLAFEDGDDLTLTAGKANPALLRRASEQQGAWATGDGQTSQGSAETQGYPVPGQYGQPTVSAGQQVGMSINGQRLTQQQIMQLANFGIQAQPGSYWYDPMSGAWGVWGQPTAGFVAPGIPVAPLPAQASNGNTGIFVNARNIPISEAMYLQQLAGAPIMPGQYWLDARGNAGAVGQPAQINFLQRAQATRGQFQWNRSGSSGWHDSDSGSGGVWIQNPSGGTGTTVMY